MSSSKDIRVAAVVLADSLGRGLFRLVDHLRRADSDCRIVLVDAATEDRLARRAMDELAERDGVMRVEVAAQAPRAARRNAGVEALGADFELVACFDPGDRPEPLYFDRARRAFADPEIAFVTSWSRRLLAGGDHHVVLPPGVDLASLLGQIGALHSATLFRRQLWQELGGFDEALAGLEMDDFWIRATRAGKRGAILEEPLVAHDPSASPESRRDLFRARRVPAATALFQKHRDAFEADPSAVLVPRERALYELTGFDREIRERRRRAVEEHAALGEEIRELVAFLEQRGETRVDWGDLRRTVPISPEWGMDRGLPVDRRYIESFLEEHRGDVRGAVLEIQEDDYTRRFGGEKVTRGDILDINPTNPRATVLADLRHARSIPDAAYDCFLLTQTVHVIDDMEAVLREAYRILKPGGVLLLTFPCLSRICLEYGEDGDFWRLTEAGARELASRVFPFDGLTTRAYGNVLVATAFLHGLAADELTDAEYAAYDPYHPMLVGVRAVKPGSSATTASRRRATRQEKPPRGVVLAYHRVANVEDDPHQLALPPVELRAQLLHLRRVCRPLPLADLVARARAGDLPERAVALTFDDGYLDMLDNAAPMLLEYGVPATFFVTGEGWERPTCYWWDVLSSFFARGDALPAVLDLPPCGAWEGGVKSFPLATGEARAAARVELYRLLLACPPAQRDEVLRGLAKAAAFELAPQGGARPMTSEEILRLSRHQGLEIGAHTVHHLALSHQPFETQQREIMESKTRLERLLERPVQSVAYPYGDAPDQAVDLVAAASFEIAVTCEERAVRPDVHPLRVPRWTVPVDVGDEFGEWLERCFS